MLWISPGNERQIPQNSGDPVQLYKQVPGMERVASLQRNVFHFVIIREMETCLSCFQVPLQKNLFLLNVPIVWKCYGLTETLISGYFPLMLTVNPQCNVRSWFRKT